jgi:hypothetical protein
MPLIKPRTRGKQKVRHITRLFQENNETLYAYATFLGEDTEYVMNQLIGAKLAKDKEFLRWRATHPESYVPRASTAAHGAKRSRPATVRGREPGPHAERATAVA